MKPHAPSFPSALCGLALAWMVGAASANTPAAAPTVDIAKGQATATTVCSACHTADGTRGAPGNPILQGQHPEYIAKQLADFKSGKRKNPVMQGIASALSEQDMRNVAAFYAGKKPVLGAARNKDTVPLGEKIFRGGIADRSVPACSGCHSPNGAGVPAQFPRLGGQHADYTAAQLTAYRDGGRTNSAQMTGVAAKLNDKEIKALADYIAGLR